MESPSTSGRLLRLAERITRTDLRYLFSGGIWLTLSQIGLALMAFGLSVAFAYFVPKDVYGTYRFLLSVAWTLTALSMSGIPTAVMRAVAQGNEGSYRKAFAKSLLWGIPMILIALIGSVYYLRAGNTELAFGLLIIAILAPLLQPAFLFGSFLEGRRYFKELTLFGFILNGVPTVLLFIVMLFSNSALLFLAAYLLGNVLTGFVLCAFTYFRYKPNNLESHDTERISRDFSVMNLLATTSQQADKLLVFHMLGAVQLATYSFAIAVPEQIKGVLNNVSALAFPKFAIKDIQEIRSNFWKRMGLFTLGLIGITAVYLLVAPILFPLFFPAYSDAVIYSLVFSISLLAISNTVPLTLLQAQAATKELYVFNIVSPAIQIILLFVLTPMYGLMGAVIARVISRFANLVILGILVEVFARRTHVVIT